MRHDRYKSKDDEELPEAPEIEVEEYNENEDEDFAPDEAGDDENISSSSEDEETTDIAKPAQKTKGAKRKSEVVEDASLDSGDEATIKERKRKKRRKEGGGGGGGGGDDEDSSGEGGFIRTRAQHVIAQEERKNRKRARDGAVTIDVEAIWADLSSIPVGRRRTSLPLPQPDSSSQDRTGFDDDEEGQNKENTPIPSAEEEMVTIKRRIEYAGEVTVVSERVPRNSKEAQRYFASHPEADPSNNNNNNNNNIDDTNPSISTNGLQKPLKRPSMFEPNPTGLVKGVAPEKLRPRAPTRTDVLMAEKRAEDKKKAQKMSTVQKSQLDWQGFVDQEGLRDELNEYGKSRKGFLAREAFLDRAAGAREQAARDARLKL